MYRLRPSTVTRPITRGLAVNYGRPLVATHQRFQSTETRPRVSEATSKLTAEDAVRISDRIKHDHRQIEQAYNKIMTNTDPDTRERWQNQFVWELARHSIAEEIVVYPAFEMHLNDGMEMAEKDRTEHQSIKEKLYEFQKMSPSSDSFIPALQSIWESLSQHIKEEERDDLPALEGVLDEEASRQLSTAFSRTKHFVPTHSHPSAPDKPPYETAAGMLSTPIDKLKDMFKKFPKEAEHKRG